MRSAYPGVGSRWIFRPGRRRPAWHGLIPTGFSSGRFHRFFIFLGCSAFKLPQGGAASFDNGEDAEGDREKPRGRLLPVSIDGSDRSCRADLMPMDSEIGRRIRELDADSSETAEDAQHALTAMGPDVLNDVMAAVPSMGRFGQLCAIEIFTALGDPKAADVLINLLDSDSDTVRQWAAEALAELGVDRAVPALDRAYDAFRQRGEPPDHSEGEGMRWALTRLGARRVVLPPRSAALRASDDEANPVWPTVHLAEVVEDLAAHAQAVLYFQIWQIGADGRRFWRGASDVDWNLDRAWAWDRNVEHCRDWAVLAAEAVDKRPDLVASISWIDATDL